MSSLKIKVAVIGAGRMGRNHLRVLAESNEFEIAGVLDPQFQHGVPAELEHFRCVSVLQQLEGIDFDCAIIAAPTAFHMELIEFFLRRNKDVFVEKPVCATAEEGRKLLAMIREECGQVYVGHVERFNPAIQKVEELLRVGALGIPVHFAFTRVGGRPSDVVAGSNVLLDLAVHDLDILHCLAGPVRVISGICHSTWKEGIYDTSEILLAGERSCSASIHSNWISPTKIRSLRITGTAGVCEVDYMLQSCTLYGGKFPVPDERRSIQYADLVAAYQSKQRTEIPVEQAEPLVNQLAGLYLALTGKESRICSASEAVRCVELAELALNLSQKFEYF